MTAASQGRLEGRAEGTARQVVSGVSSRVYSRSLVTFTSLKEDKQNLFDEKEVSIKKASFQLV